jgi:DinB superfamily
MSDLDEERYPVGRIPRNKTPLDREARTGLIAVIEQAPAALRLLVSGRTDVQLDTPYRPGGWTIRQVIHHLPDSHMNAYVRMKLAVTESAPVIKPYDEAAWAELPEARTAPVGMSLDLLDALHRRWTAFLTALPDAEFQRAFTHPDLGPVTVDEALGMYAWHCRHHTAHVKLGLQRAEKRAEV